MTELVAFLRNCLDVEEQATKAATPGPWRTPGPDTVGQWNIYDEWWTVAHAAAYDHDEPMSNKPGARGPAYVDPDANAAHIAAWDPERVLAEVAAKRRILERHGPEEMDGGPVLCRVCGHPDTWEVRFPCDTVRDLAAPYAARPGWREEWAVT